MRTVASWPAELAAGARPWLHTVLVMMKYLWLLQILFLGLLLYITSAQVTIYHTRTTTSGNTSILVQNLAVLNLLNLNDVQIRAHIFSCITIGNIEDLEWKRGELLHNVRFPTNIESIVINGRLTRVFTLVMSTRITNSTRFPVRTTDIDTYRCTDTARRQSPAVVDIRRGSTAIKRQLRNAYGVLSRDATLEVYAVTYPAQITPTQITWTKGSTIINPSDTKYSLRSLGTQLVIHDIVKEDSSEFYYASIIGGANDISSDLTTSMQLNLEVSARVHTHPSSAVIFAISNYDLLRCRIIGQRATVTWEREGAPIRWNSFQNRMNYLDGGVSTNLVEGQLQTSSVIPSDGGRYRCLGRTTHRRTDYVGTVATNYARILVLMNPIVISDPLPALAFDGTRAEISCECSGNPFPSFVWQRRGGNLPSIRRTTTNTRVSSFTNTNLSYTIRTVISTYAIDPVNRGDQGMYRCGVTRLASFSNPGPNTVSKFGMLTIVENLRLLSGPMPVAVFEGTRAQLSCSFSGFPPPNITWQGGAVSISERWKTTSQVLLNESFPITLYTVISHFTTNVTIRDDQGTYRCVATQRLTGNMKQMGSEYARLTVLMNPMILYSPPSIIKVLEGDSINLACGFSGNPAPTITWEREDGNEIPVVPRWNIYSRSFLNGSVNIRNLSTTISEFNTTSSLNKDQGLYRCRANATLGDGSLRTVLSKIGELSVSHRLASIMHVETTRTSISEMLRVVAEEGDTAPTFRCSSIPLSSLMHARWGGRNGGLELPSEVIRRDVTDSRSLDLVWNRPLRYLDSGQYMCNVIFTDGETVATLDLIVRYPANIASTFPSTVVSYFSSFPNFLVPLGYDGTVYTCSAFGWPTPTIRWLSNGQPLTGRISSESISKPNSPLILSRLIWRESFTSSDTGNYTCEVKGYNTNTFHSILLQLGPELTFAISSPCTVNISASFFQIRVLNTMCLQWDETTKKEIADRMNYVLHQIIAIECQECTVNSTTISIPEVPTCSDLLPRAAVFRGRIAVDETGNQTVFCALSEWQQKEPLIFLSNSLHLVDEACFLPYRNSTECSASDPPSQGPFIGVVPLSLTVTGGASLLLGIVLILFLWFYHIKRTSFFHERIYRTKEDYITRSSSESSSGTYSSSSYSEESSAVDRPRPSYASHASYASNESYESYDTEDL